MPFTDRPSAPRLGSWRGGSATLLALGIGVALTMTGCQSRPPQPAVTAPAVPVVPAAAPAARAIEPASKLPGARSIEQLRQRIAQRLVAANPGLTYSDKAPEVLLAIPVLEVELHADGSIRHIEVLRHPRQAKDTTQLAIEAVRRAAPFGDVSHLPRPWKVTETFLFNDERKFKPRTLE